MSCASVFLLSIGFRGFTKYVQLHELQVEKEKNEVIVRQLTVENMRRANEVERLKNDPKTLEDLARRELKLAKPEETIYLLPASEQTTTRRSAAER